MKKTRKLISVNSVVRFFDDQIRMYEELIKEEEKGGVIINEMIETYVVRKQVIIIIKKKFVELRGEKK